MREEEGRKEKKKLLYLRDLMPDSLPAVEGCPFAALRVRGFACGLIAEAFTFFAGELAGCQKPLHKYKHTK